MSIGLVLGPTPNDGWVLHISRAHSHGCFYGVPERTHRFCRPHEMRDIDHDAVRVPGRERTLSFLCSNYARLVAQSERGMRHTRVCITTPSGCCRFRTMGMTLSSWDEGQRRNGSSTSLGPASSSRTEDSHVVLRTPLAREPPMERTRHTLGSCVKSVALLETT